MDRNTVIGFILLAVLFFGYFFYNRQDQLAAQMERARMDSIARANQPVISESDTASVKITPVGADSATADSVSNAFAGVYGTEEVLVLENDVLRISFTNKGGQPKMVELKSFLSLDSMPVKLVQNNGFDKISYAINTGENRSAQTADLYFQPAKIIRQDDGSQIISYSLELGNGQTVTHQYTLRRNDYMIDWNVELTGADRLLTQQSFNLVWQARAKQQEKDIRYEKQQSQITFWENNEFDYFNVFSRNSIKYENAVQWVSVKQQFFSQVLISKSPFAGGETNWEVPHDSIPLIASAITNLRMQVPVGTVANLPFQIYYGPNDYHLLKSYKLGLENNVNLGQGFYAFVKYVNKWLVLPLFDFFKSFIGSYGIVILLLTIVIRLLISPLTYSSYLSGARMKALRPELEALKKKLGDDQQAYAMEQMKLFREAGVNPLGGCIPALLQIPIFFALFSFFNSSVDLRGQNFLWSDDLSAYDSIAQLPFYIWGFGDHVSLFTLLAVITSFLISFLNMGMTPDQNNPMLKYMPYIFPIILLGIFNSLPSALTWYYTVSNLITLVLQFVIQRFIIKPEKILAKIEANRKKPKTQSKWQERLAQMQEAQKKMQEMKKGKQ
ncbi:MAG TPA: membrane protein insertase YidC [Parasegetibacter sp.]